MKIIHEDNKILVVEKPAGIPVQADSSNDLDLLSQLKIYIKEKYNKPGNVFLGLVHRLDRPVGGVMVFAKNSKSAANLSEQIRNHTFKKSYLAIIEGKLKQQKGIFNDYLLKDTKLNKSKIVSSNTKNAKEAILEYELISHEHGKSLVKINLQTGRSHQIRVQFSSRKNPILGDKKYGSNISSKNIALWSYSIKLRHPGRHTMVEYNTLPENSELWNQFSNSINQLESI